MDAKTEKYKNEVSRRLVDFAEKVFGSQKALAEHLQMSPQSLQKYTGEKSLPGFEIVARLQKAGINANWLYTGDGEMLTRDKEPASNLKSKIRRIPLVPNIQCGIPIQSQIDDSKTIEVREVKHLYNPIVTIAEGKSMEPYIRAKDRLICYQVTKEEPLKKNKAYVIDFKSEPENYSSVCKLVHELKDGTIMLTSINTYYEPTYHNKSDIRAFYKVYRIERDVS